MIPEIAVLQGRRLRGLAVTHGTLQSIGTPTPLAFRRVFEAVWPRGGVRQGCGLSGSDLEGDTRGGARRERLEACAREPETECE